MCHRRVHRPPRARQTSAEPHDGGSATRAAAADRSELDGVDAHLPAPESRFSHPDTPATFPHAAEPVLVHTPVPPVGPARGTVWDCGCVARRDSATAGGARL